MKFNPKFCLVLLFIAGITCSCSWKEESSPGKPCLALTTSYLECAARDIGSTHFDYFRIAPPGMCPGHFDISPGVIKNLKESSLLLRFDFQDSLDKKIAPLMPDSFRIHSITAQEGLCIPETYLASLKEVYEALCQIFPEQKTEFEACFQNAKKELATLEKECLDQINESGLRGTKVVASVHQEQFCKWLGLNVVATFSGTQTNSLQSLKEIIDKGKDAEVKFIIANLQEGRSQADALSSHLGCQAIVFSNFPDMSPEQDTFIKLVKCNLYNLFSAEKEE